MNTRNTPPGGDGNGPVRPRTPALDPGTRPTNSRQPTGIGPAARAADAWRHARKPADPPISGVPGLSALERQSAHPCRQAATCNGRRPPASGTRPHSSVAGQHSNGAPASDSRPLRTRPTVAERAYRATIRFAGIPAVATGERRQRVVAARAADHGRTAIEPDTSFRGGTWWEPCDAERFLTQAIPIRPYPGAPLMDSARRPWTNASHREVRAPRSSRSMCRFRPAAPSGCAIRW